jgi:hypothetical protein
MACCALGAPDEHRRELGRHVAALTRSLSFQFALVAMMNATRAARSGVSAASSS